jgi:hypothetical protein
MGTLEYIWKDNSLISCNREKGVGVVGGLS